MSLGFGCGLSSCITAPRNPSQRALYVDLRKIAQISEDGGWIADWVRLQANVEPSLRSICQTSPATRAALDAWLETQIRHEGGPAERSFRGNGGDLSAVSESLSLEHTQELLRFGNARAPVDCPFWLSSRSDFHGVENDGEQWVLLAETLGLASYVVDTHIPAISAGGRLLLGRGIGSELTIAAGAEFAAGGAFIPGGGGGSGGGLDATFTVAAPILLRFARFSRLADIEVAPVARVTGTAPALPPGARIQLGGGFSSIRSGPFMSYYMLYFGYEFHPPVGSIHADHTLLLGTRLAVDWGL